MSDLDLARRAVACAGWRNLDGTLDTLGARLHGNLWHLPKDWDHRAFAALDYEHLPDLSDPATLGAVEALAREAWGEDAHLEPEYQTASSGAMVIGWRLVCHRLFASAVAARSWAILPRGATRAEALIAALEAAPPKETK